MTIKVFQVDRGEELEPYDVERAIIERASSIPTSVPYFVFG